MIKDKDILCIEDFVNKYKKDLKKGNITKEIKENIIATVFDTIYTKKSNYIHKIMDIYIAIEHIKYIDPPKDESLVFRLISAIIYLKNDPDFEKYNIEKLCNKAYKKLYKFDKMHGDNYLKENMEEDFLPKHLLDIEYHINNFLEYSKDDKFYDYFSERLKYNYWRCL